MVDCKFDFNDRLNAQIIEEERNIVAVAGYIKWLKGTKQVEKAACAFTVYENERSIRQDVLLCKNIESACQLELLAILKAFPFTIKNIIVVKATQPAVISGINGDLDFWVVNNWIKKDGTPVKHHELWQVLYNERERHQITALQLEEPEERKLQVASRARIYQHIG